MKLIQVMFAASTALLGVGAQAANLVVNGDFENMPSWNNGLAGDGWYTLLAGSAIPGWTIETGHGATVHKTGFYPTISGVYSINLDGEGYNGKNANLYQDVSVNSGAAGTLEFDWIGWVNTGTKFQVSLTDTVTNAVLASGNYGYSSSLSHETFNFVGTGNPLRLRVNESPESGGNDNTFIVDNFSITAVPEPGTWVAIVGGLSLLARRRRS